MAPARPRASVLARCRLTRPLCERVKATVGCARATRLTASAQCANSVASDLRNFRRAGVLRVNQLSDLFYMAEVLSKQPRPRGRRLTILTNAGGPAALAKVPEGLLVTCYDTSTLVTISLDGKTLDTTDSAKAGVSLKGVNDLAPDGKGGIYMSASGVFDVAAPIEGTVVYRAPDGSFHEVANDIHYSNGMAVTDGGKSLLVSEMLAARVLKFDVAADGSLSNRRVFVRLKDVVADPEGADAYYGPDGLKVGASGNVYIAQNGGASILVVSPEGKLVRQLPVPGKYVTNVGFGADEGTLIVTAATDPWNAPYPGEVYLVENK